MNHQQLEQYIQEIQLKEMEESFFITGVIKLLHLSPINCKTIFIIIPKLAISLKGESLRMLKKYKEAQECLMLTISLPWPYNHLLALGSIDACLIDLEEIEEAQKYFDQAQSMEPNNQWIKDQLNNFMLYKNKQSFKKRNKNETYILFIFNLIESYTFEFFLDSNLVNKIQERGSLFSQINFQRCLNLYCLLHSKSFSKYRIITNRITQAQSCWVILCMILILKLLNQIIMKLIENLLTDELYASQLLFQNCAISQQINHTKKKKQKFQFNSIRYSQSKKWQRFDADQIIIF